MFKSWIRRGDRLLTPLLHGKVAILTISLLISALVVSLKQVSTFQSLELRLLDQMVRLQSRPQADSRLLVIAITEAELSTYDWPLPDQILASVLENLQSHQPSSIGLDLYRDFPEPPGHAALVEQLKADNVIVIEKLGIDGLGAEVPPPPEVPAERVGFNDIVVDHDGVVRRNFLYAFAGQQEFYSFTFELARHYLAEHGHSFHLNRGDPAFLQFGAVYLTPLLPQAGGYQQIDTTGFQILIDYRATDIAQTVTLSDVLDDRVAPDLIHDRIVLIGSTATSIKDQFFTPHTATSNEANLGTPGVLVHAQLLSHLLSMALDGQKAIWFWPEWGELLWLLAWATVGSAMIWRFQHPLGISLSLIGGGSLLSLLSFILLLQSGWIPLISPFLAFVLSGVGVLACKPLYIMRYDGLTQLPNQTFLLTHLQWILEEGSEVESARVALLFLDLDQFKLINESLGHQCGDQLLVEVARRLRHALSQILDKCQQNRQQTRVLARVGGDEFAILLTNQAMDEVTRIADALHQELSQPFQLAGKPIFTTASIGIALSRTEYYGQPRALLRDAHTAMYRAKALGKSRHEIFTVGMHAQALERLQLEGDMRQALEQEEFELYYQPIVDLKTDGIVGFEALIRWKSAQHGFVSPARFIPLAEETEFIEPLGQWILEEACRQQIEWQTQFPQYPNLFISVNVSACQINQPGFIEMIRETLKTTEVNPHKIKLEITESAAMQDYEAAIEIMLQLKALHLNIGMDDFGTGYSSLTYLRRFPIDTLKVDRSFVTEITNSVEDAAVVQAVIQLSHCLGIEVIAEGIELETQRFALEEMACQYGQGYFFAKPLSHQDANALLQGECPWLSAIDHHIDPPNDNGHHIENGQKNPNGTLRNQAKTVTQA